MNRSIYISNGADINDSHQFWLALVLSLLIHMSFYYLLPYIKSEPMLAMKRIEVELNTVMQPRPEAPTPPAPAPKLVQAKAEPISTPAPVKPRPLPVMKAPTQKPAEVTPVLATEAPSATSDYVAPAAATTSTLESVGSNTSNALTAKSAGVATDGVATDGVATGQAGATGPVSDEIRNEYGQALYALVNKNKNYPTIAVRRNWEGEVKVLAKFVLGRLVEVTLLESAGHKPLDDEALAMLRKAINQLPLSSNLAKKTFTITVPVAFKLDKG